MQSARFITKRADFFVSLYLYVNTHILILVFDTYLAFDIVFNIAFDTYLKNAIDTKYNSYKNRNDYEDFSDWRKRQSWHRFS